MKILVDFSGNLLYNIPIMMKESENMKNLDTKIRAAMAVACTAKENLNEDGSINWNFVDADLWLDGVITDDNAVVAYEWFDGIATEFEVA